MRHPLVPGVREIVVLRANGIGDFVFALPALVALGNAYPDARITLLGLAWHDDLLAGRPGPVHRVVVLPPVRGLAADSLDEVPSLRPGHAAALLGEEPVDLAVQLHGGGAVSNPLVRTLGARCSVGAAARGVERLDRSVSYQPLQHEVLRLLEVVSLAGAVPLGLEPCLAVTEEDRMVSSALALGPRYAVLLPSAGDARRRWTAAHFAAVGDHLAARGRSVAVVGGPADRGLCAQVSAAMRHRGVVLAPGSGGMRGLTGLLADAEVVVGNDTGPLHLAAAVGTATVGVYWGPNLVQAGPLRADLHRSVVAWTLDCPVCGTVNAQQRCDHDASFVASAPVDAVLDHVDDLLSR